jgi:hypothetical protein
VARVLIVVKYLINRRLTIHDGYLTCVM